MPLARPGTLSSTGREPNLLEVAFAEQARRGWWWSQLTVDTGNRTGAPELYVSVGMRAVEIIDLYRRTLPLGEPR